MNLIFINQKKNKKNISINLIGTKNKITSRESIKI